MAGTLRAVTKIMMFQSTDSPQDRPTLLPDRPLTPEEREAHDEDPRPGVWAGQIGAYFGAKEQGDLRVLTQAQTDRLIRLELIAEHSGSERAEIEQLIGRLPRPYGDACLMVNQRGGIDSDPIVRLLAYRAWGDRDRGRIWLRGTSRRACLEYSTLEHEIVRQLLKLSMDRHGVG